MKNTTFILVLLLAFTLLAACGANNNVSGRNPKVESEKAEGSAVSEAPAGEAPRKIMAPEVTVSPGDVVFENEYIELTYEDVSYDKTYIHCRFKGITTQAIGIHNDADPLVVNGVETDYLDNGFTMMRPYEEGKKIGNGEHSITFQTNSYSALEKAGITPDELKTIQATITISNISSREDVFFEIPVLFNIE